MNLRLPKKNPTIFSIFKIRTAWAREKLASHGTVLLHAVRPKPKLGDTKDNGRAHKAGPPTVSFLSATAPARKTKVHILSALQRAPCRISTVRTASGSKPGPETLAKLNSNILTLARGNNVTRRTQVFPNLIGTANRMAPVWAPQE